jgi:hypothetical protein
MMFERIVFINIIRYFNFFDDSYKKIYCNEKQTKRDNNEKEKKRKQRRSKLKKNKNNNRQHS